MDFHAFTRKLAGICLALFVALNAPAEPTMSLDNTAAPPGATNLVPVNITVDTNVVSFQFDLWYSTNYLTPGAPIGGNALSGQQIFTNEVSPGQFRVLAVSFTDTPLTNGVAVYVPFFIAANAPDHDEPLLVSNVVFVNAAAESVPVAVSSNAILSITVPPRFTAVFPTNAGAIHLELTGTAGRTYVILAATNLVQPQWTSLITNTNVSGILPFDDVSAGDFSNRFYRAQFDH